MYLRARAGILLLVFSLSFCAMPAGKGVAETDASKKRTCNLIVDYNRDGIVNSADDDKSDDYRKGFEYSPVEYLIQGTGKGALLFVNCDDDDGDNLCDFCRNGTLSHSKRDDDLALLRVLPAGSQEKLEFFILELLLPGEDKNPEIPANERIRIFSPDGKPLLGPVAGASVDLSLPENRSVLERGSDLRMEGLRFNLEVIIRLRAKWKGTDELADAVRVRCCPFLAAPNTFEVPGPSSIFSSDENLTATITKTIGEPRSVSYFFCQTVCEMGYQQRTITKNGKSVSAVMPVSLLLMKTVEWEPTPRAGFGVYEMHGYDYADLTSIEYGGAVECLPALPGDKTNPFGTVLLARRGETRSRLVPFFERQVQRVAEIDFTGLWIDHVNELVCVVPATDAIGFRILLADIRCAVKELAGFSGDLWHIHGTFYCKGGRFNPVTLQRLTVKQVKALYIGENGGLTSGAARIQKALDRVGEFLTTGLGCPKNSIVRVPVLFDPTRRLADDLIEGDVWINYKTIPKKINYLSADIPNSQPFSYRGRNYIFLPFIGRRGDVCGIFRGQIEKKLKACGYSDDSIIWVDYYPKFMNGGHIHCSSNAVRLP